jgi:hypothetical protein
MGGEIIRRVLRIVSEEYGYTNYWIGFSPISGMHAPLKNEYANWKSFSNDTDPQMEDSDISEARKFINQYKNKEHIRNTDSTTNRLGEKFIRLYYGDTKNLINKYIKNKKTEIKERYTKRQNMSIYMSEEESKKFINSNNIVFHPLQYHIESRVTIRGRPYFNYDWIIEYISRVLPPDHQLVIKPHPNHLGTVPTNIIKNINQHGALLHPAVDSHKVIQESNVIITINNTVGYEGLLYGKPVVVLGNAFYDGCGFTIDNNNIQKLEKDIRSGIKSDGLSNHEVTEVACRTLQGSKPGIWGEKNAENVSKVATSVLNELLC